MNNIYLNNIDPVLAHAQTPYPYMPSYDYAKTDNFVQLPQFIQNAPQQKDYLSTLDDKLTALSDNERTALMNDNEFQQLNASLNSIVQKEIMVLIKGKLNSNNNVVDNINQQLNIINRVVNAAKEQERQNINMLNDYITNYPNISFAEYKAIKSGANIQPTEKIDIETVDEPAKTKKFFK